MATNISYEEAISSVREQVEAGRVCTLPLPEVTGEILGVDVVASCDVPPFPRATMDGYGRKKFSLGRIVSRGGRSFIQELTSQGSGDFVSARNAEGVFEIPLGVSRVPAGESVRFYPAWGDFFGETGDA